MKEKKNLIVLHNICETYGVTPGIYLGMDTQWGRWQMDEITLLTGRKAEREANQTQPGSTVGTGKTVGYKNAASGRKLKRVKIKPNGTW